MKAIATIAAIGFASATGFMALNDLPANHLKND